MSEVTVKEIILMAALILSFVLNIYAAFYIKDNCFEEPIVLNLTSLLCFEEFTGVQTVQDLELRYCLR